MTKYEIIGDRLASERGTLLDLGARDRILGGHLPAGIRYFSADRIGAHDHAWDLEKPLPAESESFDFVAALDVLEHLEGIHGALREMMRITRRILFLSLPNHSALSKRIDFLLTGSFGGKYALGPAPVSDRHRWITVHDQARAFVLHQAAEGGFLAAERHVREGFGRLHAMINRTPLPISLRAHTLLYELRRRDAS